MKKLIALLFLLSPINVFSQSIHEIKWLSEHFPPFNYVDENNVRKGLYVDILREIWKKTGIKKSNSDISIVPWARGVLMLNDGPGSSLFAMGITKERLKKYKFVGPVKGIKVGIIAKKSKKYRFDSISSVNQKIKRLGAVRDDSGHKLFLEAGGDSNLLNLSVKAEYMIKMLEVDRLDAISLVNITGFWEMKKSNIDTKKYELVYLLTVLESGFAFHKDTNQNTIDLLQDAFDELYKDGTIKLIENKYLN